MSGISFSSLPVFERYDTEFKKPEKKTTYFPAFTFGVNNTAAAKITKIS